MPYIDYNGREQEDAEGDNMRRDRTEQAQYEQEIQARVNRLVDNLPAGYGTVERVYNAAREAAEHYGYTGAELEAFADLAATRYREAIARNIAASVDQAEAEGRESYAVCMRCGALFTGEYCPTCDQGEAERA